LDGASVPRQPQKAAARKSIGFDVFKRRNSGRRASARHISPGAINFLG
jgi:hypothetical protein